MLKPLDDGRGVDHETAQAEDELDRRGLVMAAWCVWRDVMIFPNTSFYTGNTIQGRGVATRDTGSCIDIDWLKRELQLHHSRVVNFGCRHSQWISKGGWFFHALGL